MIHNSWDSLLQNEFEKDYFKNLKAWVKNEYETKTIYPPKEQVFNALKLTPYEDVKVVILGQDPYQTPGFANGLAFSVNDGVKIPKSLQNIYKEMNSDLGITIPTTGNLTKWAKQGVLMLNTTLTVVEGISNSHSKKGWEIFTDQIISILNNKTEPIVFILWGNNARSKAKLITNPTHLILESAHPSPLSANRGFFGSKPFSKTNEFLQKNNLSKINWSLD